MLGMGEGELGTGLFSPKKIVHNLVEWINVHFQSHKFNYVSALYEYDTCEARCNALYITCFTFRSEQCVNLADNISKYVQAKHSPFKSAHDDLMSQLSGWRRHAM